MPQLLKAHDPAAALFQAGCFQSLSPLLIMKAPFPLLLSVKFLRIVNERIACTDKGVAQASQECAGRFRIRIVCAGVAQ